MIELIPSYALTSNINISIAAAERSFGTDENVGLERRGSVSNFSIEGPQAGNKKKREISKAREGIFDAGR